MQQGETGQFLGLQSPGIPGLFFCPASRIGIRSTRPPFAASAHPTRYHSWGRSRKILAPTFDKLFFAVDVLGASMLEQGGAIDGRSAGHIFQDPAVRRNSASPPAASLQVDEPLH